MPDDSSAELHNAQGMRARDDGDIASAELAYRKAMAEAPRWSAPVYNLGLLFKYQGRWAESFELNRQATELAPGDQASWWNLGIAATAIGNWSEARRAWLACGMNPPAGDGPPDFGWGMIPVRLDPAASGEVVWARRFDPARAQILSVPLPTARFHWKDLVLTDGAQEGERVVGKRTYPVFNVLDTLEASHYRTFVIELASVTQDVVAALEKCAAECGGAAEDWGTTTRILCRACSVGTVHEHADGEHAPAHPHCGLAARDRDHAEGIVSAWLSQNPRADLITWYEAPSTV